MLDWISTLWNNTIYGGPTRNAPNGGNNIKQLIDNKPATVILLLETDIINRKEKLKPIVVNCDRPIIKKMPLMIDFDNVFDQGYNQYLQEVCKKRAPIKHVTEQSRKLINKQLSHQQLKQEVDKFCSI